jgi:hypothetical protein
MRQLMLGAHARAGEPRALARERPRPMPQPSDNVLPFPAPRRRPQPQPPRPMDAAAWHCGPPHVQESRGHGRIFYPIAVLWAWLAAHPI